MAFELSPIAFTNGLENQSAQALASLKLFATLTPPVLEADMRAEIEAGQIQPFSNEGWDAYMSVLANTPLNSAVLTNAERSIVNTIRFAVTPAPQTQCCGVVVPADLDGLISIVGYPRVGSATWEHEIVLTLDNSLSCNIKKITVLITGAPAAGTNPIACYFKECDSTGNSLFSYGWLDFAADPTGISYTLTYTFYDADGVIITTFPVTDYTLDL